MAKQPPKKITTGFKVFREELPLVDGAAQFRGFRNRSQYLENLYRKDLEKVTLEALAKKQEHKQNEEPVSVIP